MVDRMLNAIEHRGPDSGGRSSTVFSEVGFRRLSIIDLAGGDQPLVNEDGTVQCFLNGEIYNYVDLRKDLISRGHQFRTASDAEVIPHLYEEYGTDMFRHLNGMFIICLIDIAKHQLVLSRDQFGVKQLYFARTSQGMVFASELKAILASGLVEPEVDKSHLLAYLTLFYCPEPHTLVKGILKLSPGSWMRLEAGKQEEITRFYEVPTSPRLEMIDLEKAAERTRRLLWRSVELQLQADVPVGISLSGGIDSSAIACAAVHHQRSGAAPMALTIHWPDTAPDEVNSSRELCKKLHLAHEVLEIPVGNLLSELPLLGWISDEPVADPAIYSQFCIAREAARYVKVLLGGAGGDELFGGYGSYWLAKRYAAYNALPSAIQQRLRPVLAGTWMDDDSLNAIGTYRDSRLAWHSRTKNNLSLGEQALLSDYIPGSQSPFANFAGLFDRYREYDAANQQMIVDFHTYLPEQILPMLDRATMAASIEGRVPFLDGSLVDFAFSLSAKTKMGVPADGKRLLKKAISQDVGKEILERTKAGMPSPFVSFLTQHVGALRHILLAPDSYVRSILPEGWLREMTSSEQAARKRFRVLYAILTLEIWHKLFLRDQSYAKPQMTTADLFEIPSGALSA
jgi:asparagine synthase (glutamine-hydrolysing)